ncbi:c-type cytochrome [Sphingobacterium sp. UT-1RO-CII-1]|uniref:DUF7133 domain-containing protein n=1 Tax=Sphingobacterium sp. UT-1RO-CII-1 TaxID=2995225 RepID=UPI00227A465B|nr:c-type cytochrome [Sphingobacterium sp. UT-1RO-CII-1]MCY4778220.1 c-type cytochrome [Sphingobacterium sp. UT-1RO-CII-1]
MKVIKSVFLLSTLFIVFFCISCDRVPTIDREVLLAEAPVLSPQEFMRYTHVEDGFELQLVAAEPQIIAPIAMVFDDENRIWAVEMTSYMPDTEGKGEDEPTGKVVILSDEDGDGFYETRKVFLDSLRLPRSLALIGNGVLVVESPNLWYFDIVGDKPSNKTLVDPDFARGGNPEHQANGLLRGMDNWIYNANSDKRYKKLGDRWLTEKNHYRGQWGITQDDVGRLFYNNNSQNLLGDYFLPSLGSNNPDLLKIKGFNERIVDDNRTYPSRPTTGVNRGYMESVLDDSLRLASFTAACGPLIYRGGLFDAVYHQNAFVAEPAANLVKRNILEHNDELVSGRQAYEGQEFIRSDDERFRPVNLMNGPDGALYVVDMYRGVIQHKAYLTDYLKEEIKERNLELPLNCGRIYRVVPKGKKWQKAILPQNVKELVGLLRHSNAWMREGAQHKIVDNRMLAAIPLLKERLAQPANLQEYIHSLWTLQGMGGISNEELMNLIIEESESEKLKQLFTALERIEKTKNLDAFLNKVMTLTKERSTATYISFKVNVFENFDVKLALQIKVELLKHFPESVTIAQGLLSNAHQKEGVLIEQVRQAGVQDDAVIFTEWINLQESIKSAQYVVKSKELEKKYKNGIAIFKSTCQACHGEDGNGIEFLAPPLNGSEWVTGDKETLISIVLYGMKGPVTVNSKLYESPEISGEMPGIISNEKLKDEDLALLFSYLRKNWSNEASEVKIEDIIKVKNRYKDRVNSFTEAELREEIK